MNHARLCVLFWLTQPCSGSIAGETLARHAQDYPFLTSPAGWERKYMYCSYLRIVPIICRSLRGMVLYTMLKKPATKEHYHHMTDVKHLHPIRTVWWQQDG